jgi:hypothetical protein
MTETRRTIQERFYQQLLPALYRVRDDAQGQPLRALLAVLEHEFDAVLDDTQGLYDDLFIETCKEWVVPYLGDSLGAGLLRSVDADGFSARAHVANTLAYRRRKGTASVLEQLARDVTGWPARAVEYFERLATTQHLGHLGRRAAVTVSLRHARELELNDGPLGTECHTADVRSIVMRRGRFNIANIGLHLWRLRAYPLKRVEARSVESAAGGPIELGRYTFDPLGFTGPLFNSPRAESSITHLAEERDLPAALRRRALHAELAGLHAGGEPSDGWFGPQPVLRVVRVDATGEVEIDAAHLHVCNLELDESVDWPRPGSKGTAFIDPQAGRLTLPGSAVEPAPQAVLVDFSYAFSADVGGGPYDRRQTVPERLDAPEGYPAHAFHHAVSIDEKSVSGEIIHANLEAAIDAWNRDALLAWDARRSLERVISILDSRSYGREPSTLTVVAPPGCLLRLVAARWPTEVPSPDSGGEKRSEGRLDPSGVRPHLRGHLEVRPLADPLERVAGGRIEIDGLLIEGPVSVLPGGLAALALRHSTLVPGSGGVRVVDNPHLELELTRCIVDGVSWPGQGGGLTVSGSILDVGGLRLRASVVSDGTLLDTPWGRALLGETSETIEAARLRALLDSAPNFLVSWEWGEAGASIAADGADARIETSTLLGSVALRKLDASECLFVGGLRVQITQEGCLRYCFASPDSRTPRRFQCQPDLALAAAQASPVTRAGSEAARVRARVRPTFTSTHYGHPGYAQLTRNVARELATGAESGAEMGAFGMLQQAPRESNLAAALDQYLRFGLDAGWFFAT